MSVALFTAPVEATNNLNGLPILILGFSELGEWLVVNDEGNALMLANASVTLDWRYNWRDHTWVTVNEVLNDTQDDAPDGGQGVSGSIPDADDLGESDPLDEKGRPATSDPGDLDTGEATDR